MRILALTGLLTLLLASVAVAAAWRRPVPGAVTRPFDYNGDEPFRAGRHRGADLAASPGASVRAACAGVVLTARGGALGVVTLRCGSWRVTHLPLASVLVRRGTRVVAGQPIGTLAPSRAHTGLHLGVRHAGDRFTYVDPLPFLGGPSEPVPPAAAPRRTPPRVAAPRRVAPGAAPRPVAPRAAPRPVAPRVAAPRVAVPRAGPSGAPARFRAPPAAAPRARVRVPAPGERPALAPWPAWLGLASLLLGAAGGGVRIGLRRRRAALAAPASEAVA